jgi:hypothetical protein
MLPTDDGRLSGLESAQGLLTLALGAVPVDGGDGESLPVQELVQLVSALLCLNKHQRAASLHKLSSDLKKGA